jgi:hypothetical protein
MTSFDPSAKLNSSTPKFGSAVAALLLSISKTMPPPDTTCIEPMTGFDNVIDIGRNFARVFVVTMVPGNEGVGAVLL